MSAFVTDARAALGGHEPGSIEIDDVALLLGAGSTGVTGLGQIFAGQVDVLFIMNDTNNNTFPVGQVTIDDQVAGGPVDVAVTFDPAAVQGDDWTKLLGGSFKVAIRGPAAAGFAEKGAEANLQTTFTFAAYE